MITTIPYGHSTSYVKIPNFIFIYVVSIQVLFYSFFRIPMCLSPFQMTPACLSTLTPIQHTHLFRGNALTPRLWQLKPAKPPKAEGESTQGDSRPQSNWVTHLEKTQHMLASMTSEKPLGQDNGSPDCQDLHFSSQLERPIHH